MTEFAMRQPDGTWVPFDEEGNRWLSCAMKDGAGRPNTITVVDEAGEAHTLSSGAWQALHMALLAMDARLRPERAYQEKADEIYTGLAASLFGDGIQELRQVFQLGARRPWAVE